MCLFDEEGYIMYGVEGVCPRKALEIGGFIA